MSSQDAGIPIAASGKGVASVQIVLPMIVDQRRPHICGIEICARVMPDPGFPALFGCQRMQRHENQRIAALHCSPTVETDRECHAVACLENELR